MIGNVAIDLAVSLTGVVILVGVSYLLGAWKTVIVDDTTAAERLRFDEPDFAPENWLVDSQGRAALASNAAGETALVFRKGDALASRRLKPGEGRVDRDDALLRVKLAGDHTMSAIVFDAGDAETADVWARKIAGDYGI